MRQRTDTTGVPDAGGGHVRPRKEVHQVLLPDKHSTFFNFTHRNIPWTHGKHAESTGIHKKI